MKLTLGEKTKLIELSEMTSDLLVEMLEEDIPKTKKPTEKDIKIKKLIFEIYKICPLLSDSYASAYNCIQKGKISKEDSYIKRLRRENNGE